MINKAISFKISSAASFSRESRSVAKTIRFFPFLKKFLKRATSGMTSTGTRVFDITFTVLLPISSFFKPLAPFVLTPHEIRLARDLGEEKLAIVGMGQRVCSKRGH
jgi:hypothetical protein